MARAGRRVGRSGTQDAILAAARREFAASGYDGATTRGIAAHAGVDPALLRHFFGSKEQLFVEAVRFGFDPAEALPRLMATGTDGLGERVARLFFGAWDKPDGAFLGVLRSVSTNEQAAEMMRQFVARELIGRLTAALELDQPALRAALAGSHLLGLAVMRFVIRLEPIASMEREELVRWVAPTLQRYLTS